MNSQTEAPHGALSGVARAEDSTVRWLNAGHRLNRRRSRPRRVLRAGLAIGVSAVFSALQMGTATAPAGKAFASIDPGRFDKLLTPETTGTVTPPPGDSSEPLADFVDALIIAAVEPPAMGTAFNVDLAAQIRAAATLKPDPNEILTFGQMRVSRWLVETVLKAADVTGVDPIYMLALADKESSFIPHNRASTSSAEGLFQFITKTWLEMIRDYGAKHGLAAESALVTTVKGEITILDAAERERVLDLRRDPYLAALMAGEMLKRDRARVEARIGRELTRTEYYLPHFFGAVTAGRFLELVEEEPQKRASRVFPAAARANRALFFRREGRKVKGLTVAEVWERIDRLMEQRVDRYTRVEAVAPHFFSWRPESVTWLP
jgi:hypothetical protein